jgi:hypothetical protein
MNIQMNIQTYASYLGVTLVFIILVLRAVYYTFVVKSDPIKTLKPPNPFKVLLKYSQDKRNKKIKEAYS